VVRGLCFRVEGLRIRVKSFGFLVSGYQVQD